MAKLENISLIDQHVIDFVKKLRADKKMSQKDIAYILEKSPAFIGNVESPKNPAKYNLTHINLLADHFGISPRTFLPKEPLI